MLSGYREFGEPQPPRTIRRRIADWWSEYKIDIFLLIILIAIIGLFVIVIIYGIQRCPNCNNDCDTKDNYCKNCGQNLRPTTPNN